MTGRGNRRRHSQARAERAASWQQWRERLSGLPWHWPASIAGVAGAVLLLAWGGRMVLDQAVQLQHLLGFGQAALGARLLPCQSQQQTHSNNL